MKVLMKKQGTGIPSTGIPAPENFYTADLVGTSWAPSFGDGSSNDTSRATVNLGQKAFQYSIPVGYQPWASSYNTTNWLIVNNVTDDIVQPPNLGISYYNEFRTSGKYYIEYEVLAHNYPLIGVINELASDFSSPWSNSDINNHCYWNPVTGDVRNFGGSISYSAGINRDTAYLIQMFVDIDNKRWLVKHPNTDINDYTNYIAL